MLIFVLYGVTCSPKRHAPLWRVLRVTVLEHNLIVSADCALEQMTRPVPAVQTMRMLHGSP